MGVKRLILEKNFLGNVDYFFIEVDAREIGLTSQLHATEATYIQSDNLNKK